MPEILKLTINIFASKVIVMKEIIKQTHKILINKIILT